MRSEAPALLGSFCLDVEEIRITPAEGGILVQNNLSDIAPRYYAKGRQPDAASGPEPDLTRFLNAARRCFNDENCRLGGDTAFMRAREASSVKEPVIMARYTIAPSSSGEGSLLDGVSPVFDSRRYALLTEIGDSWFMFFAPSASLLPEARTAKYHFTEVSEDLLQCLK